MVKVCCHTEHLSLNMGDDLDVIKMGAWIKMKKLFDERNNLYVYWILLCLLSTIIQIYFFKFMI